ncbi:MAG: amidohydrolase [Ruminococcaceae bacterium]|nr:amidohydrolase [Oscillospiraceae bacterium]
MMSQTTIIDTHTHIFPDKIAEKATAFVGDYYHYPTHGNGTIADLLTSASSAGVEKLLVFSSATKAEQVESVNTFIAENISDTIAGFGSMHPDYTEFEKEIERMLSMGLKGIKLHPDFQHFDIDDPRMYPIYEAAQGKLTFIFHVGDKNYDYSSPRRLAKVMKDFPNLTVIGAHLGGHSRWDEALDCLIGRNLYIDTSSVHQQLDNASIVNIIRKHDINRVLFATDYPLMRHDVALEKFFALGLSSGENEKILYENAQKLLFSNEK